MVEQERLVFQAMPMIVVAMETPDAHGCNNYYLLTKDKRSSQVIPLKP
jgi:hypothetical protein